MQCPRCLNGDFTCVLNTVHRQDGSIRRRHGCRYCQIRWTSTEEIAPGSLVAAPVPRPIVGEVSPRPGSLAGSGGLPFPEDRHADPTGGDLINEPANAPAEDT